MPLQATSGSASYDAFGGGVAAVPNYIEDVFSTYLIKPSADYTTYSINNGIDLSTKGGMTWFKARDAAQNNLVYDTARGSSSGSPNALITNSTAAQQTAYFDYVTPNTNGFTVNYLSGGGQLTNSGINYASWTFRKQPKFFDVVTYTGDGASSKTIAHNLGSVPGCIIVKPVDLSGGWLTYHQSLGNTKGVYLNTTAAQATSTGFWNNTSPTSTQFTVGSTSNDSGYTFVAYIFAHDAGGFGLTGTDNVISCGSFTCDGNGNGIVNLGYEPQWVLYKRTDSASYGDWRLLDTMRGWVNGPDDSRDAFLKANSSDAESLGYQGHPTATGFEAKGNSVGSQFIYIAIRRGPMKVPTSGTSVFSPVTRTGTGSATTQTAGFPVDLFIPKTRNGGTAFTWSDRLRGDVFVQSANANAENYPAYTTFDNQTGVNLTSYFYPNNAASEPYVNYNFRRAPSFFDEVCYTGTGVATTQAHNLGVVPELVIYKTRNNTQNWTVYLNYDYEMYLNLTFGLQGPGYSGNHGAPTSTTISVDGNSNTSGTTYVAYLFATCAGVSKVGSYTGTGTTLQVDCGFTGGARFVLIKKTSGTGSWYVWDSARGIVSGNDPYLLLNSTAAEVTSTDYIDTYSAGFEISSTAPSEINESGGSFIFLAIA